MKRILITYFLTSVLLPQGEAGAIFLLISPSPTMNGLGEVGVCLPSNDIFAGYFNPANGIKPYSGIGISTSKMSTSWLPNLADDLLLKYSVLGLGIIPQKYPFQIVISQHKTKLDLGEQIYTGQSGEYLGTFHSYLKADALMLGARYSGSILKIPVELSVGISKKTAIQKFAMFGYGLEEKYATSSNEFYDYGILFSTPFNFRKLKTLHEIIDISIIPSFGYSVSNVGGYISFFDPNQADPAPRLLRIGLSLSANISFNSEWNVVEWKGARSVSDILIDTSDPNDTPYPYQSGLGDIDIVEHIIKSKAEPGIEIHRGDEITIFDFYSIRAGRRIDQSGKINLYTNGYGYELKGLFQFLYYLTGNQSFINFSQYVNIQYNYSKWNDSPGRPIDDINFDSFVITFNNLDQFFSD